MKIMSRLKPKMSPPAHHNEHNVVTNRRLLVSGKTPFKLKNIKILTKKYFILTKFQTITKSN